MILAATAGFAQDTNYPKAKVSFDDFKGLVAEVETHRASRLIDLNTFLKMSKEPGVIILDSRSTFRFDRIHVKGARHLAFTDFTQDNLAESHSVFRDQDTDLLQQQLRRQPDGFCLKGCLATSEVGQARWQPNSPPRQSHS